MPGVLARAGGDIKGPWEVGRCQHFVVLGQAYWLTGDERCVNLLHAAVRAPAERGNSLLKTTFKALRRVSLCPWRIGAITAAALVLLHHMHDRTT